MDAADRLSLSIRELSKRHHFRCCHIRRDVWRKPKSEVRAISASESIPNSDYCSVGLLSFGATLAGSSGPYKPNSAGRTRSRAQISSSCAKSRVRKRTKKSLKTSRVFSLCRLLFVQFSETDLKVALALANRRNDELHSGSSCVRRVPIQIPANGVL